MALDSTIQGEVLRRFRNTFTPRPTAEEPDPAPITYYQADIFDPETATFYTFRSSDAKDLAILEAGTAIQNFPVRVDKRSSIQSMLCRPANAETVDTF